MRSKYTRIIIIIIIIKIIKKIKIQQDDKHKILWDFNIQKDKVIEHRRSDIVCINKQTRECQIIDFAIPGDQNTAIKE